MPPQAVIPDSLRCRPFTVAEARALGVSHKRLLGKSFRRLYPRVWVRAAHQMSPADYIEAARLSMPDDARLTGITRIQALGLGFGPAKPYRFVVARDLHRVVDDIFLHRTEVMPPCDDFGVTPAAAFIAYCADARVIDAIKVGDWLLHHGHMTTLELRELAKRDRWRPGAREAAWVSRYLDGGAASLPESETRAVLVFSGLPVPEVNVELADGPTVIAIVDLLFRLWRVVVEYEGSQHQADRAQYLTDIERYRALRAAAVLYVQVTKEKLGKPRSMVTEVYQALVESGYEGPAPVFGDRWNSLFGTISAIVRQPVPPTRRGR